MGALNKENNKYEKPSTADKKNKYICPDCKRDVIVKKGNIKVHHFAHKSQEDPCIYYKHPSETQIHKDAKMLMKNILESKRVLSFNRYCLDCEKAVKKIVVDAYTESTKIEVEHRFQYNDALQIADVAYLDSNEIKFIFEICHTHKTGVEKRPEPWFEIDALSFINSMNDEGDQIKCIREERCEKCIKQKAEWELGRPEREEKKRKLEEERKIKSDALWDKRFKRDEKKRIVEEWKIKMELEARKALEIREEQRKIELERKRKEDEEWERGRPEREERWNKQMEEIKEKERKKQEEWERDRPEREERWRKEKEEQEERKRKEVEEQDKENKRKENELLQIQEERKRRAESLTLLTERLRNAETLVKRCGRCKQKRCKECDNKILKLFNESVRSK